MATKGVEKVRQPLAHLRVGIEFPIPVGTAHIASGQQKLQLSLACFIPASFVQSRAQRKQFCFRQSPFYSQQ